MNEKKGVPRREKESIATDSEGASGKILQNATTLFKSSREA